jgi:hypothetical protein
VNAAEDSARINREAQLEERRKLAEVAGVQIPVMPPREPGETDRDFCIRLAWIAKSYCGPPPRPKQPPKRMVKPQGFDTPEKPPELSPELSPEAERLEGMNPDFTSEDDP